MGFPHAAEVQAKDAEKVLKTNYLRLPNQLSNFAHYVLETILSDDVLHVIICSLKEVLPFLIPDVEQDKDHDQDDCKEKNHGYNEQRAGSYWRGVRCS